MSTPANLVAFLDESARTFPDRTAIVDVDGSSLTYRQLNEQSARLAGTLAARGIRPGDRVGILLPKSAAAVTALFGIMKAGAAYVPADYTAPAERNRSILTDCAVKAAIIDPACVHVLEGDAA